MFRKLTSSLAKWPLALICIAAFALMLWAAHTDSAIDDELAHIPAGYGYVHNFDYRLNPEHPPLVKALAMLPVLFLNPTFPTNDPAWTTDVNGQWGMGSQFLYESGNDANAIIQAARIMPMLLTILAIIFLYLLGRRLMGDWWALLPTFLFAFDPTVLGQGHYVTTDVGAAFGVIVATYFFLKFIETPSTKHLWWAGLSFGVAQITKFSTPLVTILFVFLTLVLWIREMIVQWNVTAPSRRFKKFLMRGLRYFWKLILIIVIGYGVVVYPIYVLFTFHYPAAKQISDTTALLASFANGPTQAGHLCQGIRCVADADIWMAKIPILRPFAEYLLGLLMVLQRTVGGNTIYFLGHIVNSGGWIYFPVLFLLKEPIPVLALIFLAFGLTISQLIKKRNRFLDYFGTNFAEFSMASFIILYWGYSMHSPLNIGWRHIIPTLPFVYILTAGVIKKWVTRINFGSMMQSIGSAARILSFSALKYIFLIILLAWLFLETLFAAPYFLSYFNEFGGGVSGGYRYVTDSNYDWGQDLLRLQSFVSAHPEIDKIAIDYFGGGSPKYYLGNKEIDWSSSKGNPASQGIHWLAISINQLQGATEPLASGLSRNASDTYSWLTTLRPTEPGMGNVPPPDYRIGTSIFVYKL